MTALVTLMLLAAAASLLLGAGRRRLAALPLLGELVMLLAMLDTHLPALGLAPPLLWSALLALCALGTALVERMRRHVAGARHADSLPADRPHADRLHTVGMLIAAGFIAAGTASSIATAPGAHAHGGLGLQVPLLMALAVYAVAATAGLRGRATPRRERLRRAASAVALLAMGGMALA